MVFKDMDPACWGWTDGLPLGSLSFDPPHPSRRGSSGGPAYATARLSLQGGLWTGSWLYSSAPPPTFTSCCWSLAWVFPVVVVVSWYQARRFTCLTLAPPPRRSGEFQHSRGAVKCPATWKDRISKLFYFSLPPNPPSVKPPALTSALYSLKPFCFLYLIIIFY